MKTILLASALMITGTAFAQADPRDAGQPIGSGATLKPGTTMGDRDTMGKNAATVNSDGSVTTPQREDAAATAAAQAGTQPGTTMSDPAAAPATTMTDPATGATSTATDSSMGTTGSGTVQTQTAGNMTAPPEPRAEYPRCSRTVTDNCVQNEARARDTKRTRR